MNTANKIVWFHSCHGLLGVYNNIEELCLDLKNHHYPKPDIQKVYSQLTPLQPFHYALGLLHIQMTKVNDDIDDVIHKLPQEPEPSVNRLHF